MDSNTITLILVAVAFLVIGALLTAAGAAAGPLVQESLERARPPVPAPSTDDLGLVERSMGMSGDFEIAVEQGATQVRLGTALLGERPG